MVRVMKSMVAVGLLVLAGCQSGSPVADHPEYDKIQKEIGQIINTVRLTTGPSLVPSLERLKAYDVFAVEPLLDLAQDPSPRLRSNALYVLSEIRDPSYPSVQKQIDRALWKGLDDQDRLVRYEAANGLLARNHWDSIPTVIEGLNDADPSVRYSCHQTLRMVTSQDFGYSADSSTEDRVNAVARWKAWYQEWAEING